MEKITEAQALKGLYLLLLRIKYDDLGNPLGDTKSLDFMPENNTVLLTLKDGQQIGYTVIVKK